MTQNNPPNETEETPQEDAAGIHEYMETLTTTCSRLVDTIDNHQNTDHTTLKHQTQLLDQLLYTIIERNITIENSNTQSANAETNPYRASHHARSAVAKDMHTMQWLNLALRIQKQCVETIKASSTIDYMNSLTQNTPKPLPRAQK